MRFSKIAAEAALVLVKPDPPVQPQAEKNELRHLIDPFAPGFGGGRSLDPSHIGRRVALVPISLGPVERVCRDPEAVNWIEPPVFRVVRRFEPGPGEIRDLV